MSHHGIDILKDCSNNSLSVIYTDTLGKYIQLVEQVYKDQGGIEGQRRPLKTKTGIRIRSRMIEDIVRGAILPPIVIGAVVSDTQYQEIEKAEDPQNLIKILDRLSGEHLSIIDGMQRTTAILEAMERKDSISGNPIRLELWVSKTINSLIYRMLILNTGQVPWDIKRQLQTIYKPLITEIQNQVEDIHIFQIDDNSRRSQTGQYQASKIIEYFLSFTSRKVSIDTKEKVADDFARMNAAEATSKDDLLHDFITVLQLMVKLDHIFGMSNGSEEIEGKISSGRDIFTSAPAGFGFVAAAAVKIFGRPGIDYDIDTENKNKEIIFDKANALINKLEKLDGSEISIFLDLIGLNEKLSTRSGKVGEYERELYFKAFTVLFEEGANLSTMAPCWEAL